MTDSARISPDTLLAVLPEESAITDDGVLTIGGCRLDELAEQFGTPAYIVDDAGLRRQLRRFTDGLHARRPRSEVLFASKSLPCVAMYAVASAEGLSIDVAGGGELVMALSAGVDPARIYLHGNAKSDAEIEMALRAGVRAIIVDNEDELDRIERLVVAPQDLLVRIIPGVAPKTHASQVTGGNDSKFGVPIGWLERITERITAHPLLHLSGIHLHIGSQVLDTAPFVEAVKATASAGTFETYDVGGGLGVQYTLDEPAPSVEDYLDSITAAARDLLPRDARMLIEPGRSLVARAGLTLYRVNTVKRTGRTFVAVDGGMADNLDIALTGQRYEALLPAKMHTTPTTRCDVVGRQCESGDLLVRDALLADPHVGDLLAIPVTGAYSYTLANNYNGAPRPPIVFCANGVARLAVRRETYEDMLLTHQPAFTGTW